MIIYIEVEVEHMSGPFRSKSDIAQAVNEELDGAMLDVDGSEYEVVSVSEGSPDKITPRQHRAAAIADKLKALDAV